MEHYVTLFDFGFLPQGLALHASMCRHLSSFNLWVICVDDEAYDALERLGLSNLRPLKLSELETEELRTVKQQRTIREYCWTLTPFAPRFVFEAESKVSEITYIDADMWFVEQPKEIKWEFAESGKHVLITEHAYSPEHDQSAQSGKYCVQYVTFKNTAEAELVRKDWERACVEWCYARYEDGKFGDQKYLEKWPTAYGSLVHVLKRKELILAPWNAARFPYSDGELYHFQSLRIVSQCRLDIGHYFLPKPLLQNIYGPYVLDLRAAADMMKTAGLGQVHQGSLSYKQAATRVVTKLYRAIKASLGTGYMKW